MIKRSSLLKISTREMKKNPKSGVFNNFQRTMTMTLKGDLDRNHFTTKKGNFEKNYKVQVYYKTLSWKKKISGNVKKLIWKLSANRYTISKWHNKHRSFSKSKSSMTNRYNIWYSETNSHFQDSHFHFWFCLKIKSLFSSKFNSWNDIFVLAEEPDGDNIAYLIIESMTIEKPM
jgi:hypothetical protein